jgi:hypothetical protein
VDGEGHVAMLDPAAAKTGSTITLDARGAIENVLLWLDDGNPPGRSRRRQPRRR